MRQVHVGQINAAASDRRPVLADVLESDILYRWVLAQVRHPENRKAAAILRGQAVNLRGVAP